jgi:hypothetical protein
MCARVKNGRLCILFAKHEIDLRSIYDVNPMRMKNVTYFPIKKIIKTERDAVRADRVKTDSCPEIFLQSFEKLITLSKKSSSTFMQLNLIQCHH